MALQPGRRYIGHFLGLASDGKPIYAAYCCVPEPQSDSDLSSFDSVSESTSESGSWDSYQSFPDSGGSAPSGGVPCGDCLARLCVVRDETGRIVDIYYYTDDGDYVRVPDCGYYGSSPSSDSGSGNSGGGGDSGGGDNGGGGGGDACCPQQGSSYMLEYDFVVFGQQYTGTIGPSIWQPTIDGVGIIIPWAINNPLCAGTGQLNCLFEAKCFGAVYEFFAFFGCGANFCIATSESLDFDYVVTGCPNNPTIYVTVNPFHHCLSGSFVLRPA